MKHRLYSIFSICILLCLSQYSFAQKEKPVSMPKANKKAAIMAAIGSMSREDKNTMTKCPVHSKNMPLSDNYRADASDFRRCDDYPFAHQLNYRRYCNACTKILAKEVTSEENKNKVKGDEGTFDRCELHNKTLYTNSRFDSGNYEKAPNLEETPHAKQYKFRKYCKVCTKVHKIQASHK